MTPASGFIVTFYSYKGGVGRTMALANIAVLLAQKGLKTLAIDFDLEAPGLHRYFQQFGIGPEDANEGMLDILVEAGDGRGLDWRKRLVDVDLKDRGHLSMLTSGRHDEGYAQRVLDFNWRDFFEHCDGGQHIEQLRDEWRDEFNVVLVDSRTGITDSGGVCTIQLPDVLVPMFTANNQSVQGCRSVAVAAQQARQKLAFDRPPLLVFPLPSRFDGRAQYEESKTWLTTFATELGDFYASWVPKPIAPREVLERTKLPYVAFFSFGEKLPVIEQGTTDPEGLGYALSSAATLIAARFQGIESILFSPSPTESAGSSAEVLLVQWGLRASLSADAHRAAANRKRRQELATRISLFASTLTIAILVGVFTGAWVASAGIVLATLGLIALQSYLRTSDPWADNVAAAAAWDGILDQIVQLQGRAISADSLRDGLEALKPRIEDLERTAPPIVLPDAIAELGAMGLSPVDAPDDRSSFTSGSAS